MPRHTPTKDGKQKFNIHITLLANTILSELSVYLPNTIIAIELLTATSRKFIIGIYVNKR